MPIAYDFNIFSDFRLILTISCVDKVARHHVLMNIPPGGFYHIIGDVYEYQL
jgi:hypothetical protein